MGKKDYGEPLPDPGFPPNYAKLIYSGSLWLRYLSPHRLQLLGEFSQHFLDGVELIVEVRQAELGISQGACDPVELVVKVGQAGLRAGQEILPLDSVEFIVQVD